MKKVQIKNKTKGFFGLFATLALAIGVGVSLAPREILKAKAVETYTWTAANGIQTQFSSQTGTATLAGLDWSYTKSNASANVTWNTNAIQVGANGSPTGFIMSATLPSSYGAEVNKVTVETASYQGAHKFSISVGGTVLVEPKATASWTSTGSITTGDIPVGVNGIIELNWTVGTRAMYIKSIAIEGRGPSASFETLESIAIKTPATKRSFYVGETFSSAGLVLTATDNSVPPVTKDVTSGFTTDFDGVKFTEAHLGLQDVEVSYKEGDVTKTVNYEIQVNEEPTYKTYTKITSISDLHLGANYIITGVKGTDTYVMTTTQNEHNRAAETMALVDGKIVEKANTQKIQLVTGTKSNSFGLKAINGDAQGYLSAASSGSNYLHTLEELTDNGSWAITFSGANLSVKAQGSFTRNDFRFNANNNPPLFSAYGSGQTAISMWVDETSINTDTTIYDEAKAFSDWLLSVPESESCEAKFAIAQSKWEELSASAKNEFKANAEFQPAENRLLQWALANGLSSLADLDASGEGVRNPNVKSNNTLLLTITILVGVIALTTLTGIYFIKKRQTQR